MIIFVLEHIQLKSTTLCDNLNSNKKHYEI
jgi:hypothetical protein